MSPSWLGRTRTAPDRSFRVAWLIAAFRSVIGLLKIALDATGAKENLLILCIRIIFPYGSSDNPAVADLSDSCRDRQRLGCRASAQPDPAGREPAVARAGAHLACAAARPRRRQDGADGRGAGAA